MSDRLLPEEQLNVDELISSPNQRFDVLMQSDGNLVVYDHDPHATWGSGTENKPGTTVKMQSDGNLVAYNNGNAVWSSNTFVPGSISKISDEGDFRVVAPNRQIIWSTVPNKIGQFEPPELVVPDKITGPALLDIKGNYGNFFDSAGRIVYTPALPGAPENIYKEWTNILRAKGTTHIPFDPKGGYAYPQKIDWPNPDGYANLPQFRKFVEKVLNTSGATGKGLVPIIFIGGDYFDNSYIDRWDDLSVALNGLHQYIIICVGWELVPGQWTSNQYSQGLIAAHKAFPNSYLMVHFQPTRWVGSSNPIEPDDPWQGGESEFYKSHGGEFVDIVGYQTPHGWSLNKCGCLRKNEKFGHEDSCYLNRFEDGVARCGTGYNGWRIIHVCAFETIVWELFNSGWDEQTALTESKRIATEMKGVADKWGCKISFGNGLP